MLSIAPLKNAQAAKSYYEKDNYYAKASEEAAKLSHWWGKSAQILSLNGYVKVEVFEKLLEGELPSGQQLGRMTEKGKVHRPGYDLTFSAPKSVSLLAEVGDDHCIYSAHDKAVAAAMAYVENHAIKTRVSHNKEIVFEHVDNLIVAMFRHDTSREQDPSTHTHCVVLNMIQREDGQWRSISSEALFDHKMAAGMVYRAQLAVELQQLGYEIEQTHSDGRFEIKGVSKEVTQYFSQRRQQIEERLEKEGWEGGKASAKVTLDTRKRKQEIEREHLKETWQQRCIEINFDPKSFIETSKLKAKTQHFTLQNPLDIAQEALQYAVAHLGEREAVFPEREVIRESLAYSLGKTTLNHIQKAIQIAHDKGDLIAYNRDHWTTLEALKLEENNIHQMKEGQGQCLPMATLETVKAFTAAKEIQIGKNYTKGQRDAIELILTTQDKVVGVHGISGSGKTTLLAAVKEFATTAGYDLFGLAPSKNAEHILDTKSQISCMTIHKYLIERAKKNQALHANNKPLLIILDEASMVSSRQMNQLLPILKLPHVRLVMLGDTKQLSSVEAGKPYYQLIKAGMKTVFMNEILRQKSKRLKEAVYDAVKGNIKEAFAKIDITEVSHKDKRLQNIVNEYLSYSPEGRQRTMVLVPANEDRVVVNKGIREGLKKEGLLQGEEIPTSTLVSRGFSKTYISRVMNYAEGDIVRFNKTYKNLGVKAGDYWRVQTIHRESNEIVLEHLKDHKQITWNPAKIGGRREGAIEVYQLEQRALMAGDKIRWLRNVGHDRINAQMAEILRVENNTAEVRLQNNNVISLDLNQPENKHWDYGFAYTVYAKQGDENTHVIAHLESYRKKLTTQQAFYVIIGRAEYQVRLVVDNREDCIKTIEKYTGEKSSALDAINKPETAQDWKSLLAQDQAQKETWIKQQQQTKQAKWQASLTPNTTTTSFKHWNIEDLQQRLSERANALAKQLLGEPNHKLSSNRELRYGKKGSLWIPIAGKHVGGWRNFETGEKGNLIQLIQHATGSSFKDSLDYAGQFLGLTPETARITSNTHSAKQKHTIKDKSLTLDAEDRKAIARAIRIEQESRPIAGTLAERYLREHRAITGELPDTFRFHPRMAYFHIDDETKKIKRKDYFPALICVAKNQEQQTQAVQVIYLDTKTANKAAVEMSKRTYGRPSLGAAVNINPGQAKVLLAEGPETGLSVAQAYPEASVMITLSISNFSNVKLKPEQKEVIICMDNDGSNALAHKAIINAANVHQANGHAVYLTQPDQVNQDFNDVLKEQGGAEIRRKIDSATLFQDALNGYEQHPFDKHVISPYSKEIAEWLEHSGHDEAQNSTAIVHQLETNELLPDKLEERASEALLEAEMSKLKEADLAEINSLNSYLENTDLPFLNDDFDLQI